MTVTHRFWVDNTAVFLLVKSQIPASHLVLTLVPVSLPRESLFHSFIRLRFWPCSLFNGIVKSFRYLALWRIWLHTFFFRYCTKVWLLGAFISDASPQRSIVIRVAHYPLLLYCLSFSPCLSVSSHCHSLVYTLNIGIIEILLAVSKSFVVF